MKLSRPLVSWAFYDFANTIFSAIVLTAYFPLYFTELTGTNWGLGAATTAAMLLAGACTPFLGGITDRTGKTKTYLIRSTLLTLSLLALFTFIRQPLILAFIFLLACFFYHASLVFYNSLLPVAAPPEKQGFASGLGTGLGYLGVVLTLPLAHLVEQKLGVAFVFIFASILFLIFSLPLFAFVPEREVAHPSRFKAVLIKKEWKKILALFRELPQKPKLLLFLGGNFFVVDALNSGIFWLMVYTREVYGPTQEKLILFLMAINLSAFLMGILCGFLTDRLGAMKTLLLASGALACGLAALALSKTLIIFILATLSLGAFGIAGVWTSGRKVLIELAPKSQLGEYFGLYGLTTKVSILGNLAFAVVADLAGFRSALWMFVFPACVGWVFLFLSYRFKSTEQSQAA